MKNFNGLIFGLLMLSGVSAYAEALVVEAGERPLAHDDAPNNVATNNYGEIKALQQDIQELRSQLEQQAYEIQKLKSQTTRPDKIAVKQASPGPTAIIEVSKNTNNNSESNVYLAAYDFINLKQDSKAMQAFQDFLLQYPNGGYAPNAHYWLGELNMRQQHYENALSEFQWVLDNTPKASKVPDCLLKQGFVYAAMGENDKAHATLKRVMQQFPDTAVAHLASKKIQSL